MSNFQTELDKASQDLYCNDARFHALVKMLADGFVLNQFTPIEILGAMPMALRVMQEHQRMHRSTQVRLLALAEEQESNGQAPQPGD